MYEGLLPWTDDWTDTRGVGRLYPFFPVTSVSLLIVDTDGGRVCSGCTEESLFLKHLTSPLGCHLPK